MLIHCGRLSLALISEAGLNPLSANSLRDSENERSLLLEIGSACRHGDLETPHTAPPPSIHGLLVKHVCGGSLANNVELKPCMAALPGTARRYGQLRVCAWLL